MHHPPDGDELNRPCSGETNRSARMPARQFAADRRVPLEKTRPGCAFALHAGACGRKLATPLDRRRTQPAACNGRWASVDTGGSSRRQMKPRAGELHRCRRADIDAPRSLARRNGLESFAGIPRYDEKPSWLVAACRNDDRRIRCPGWAGLQPAGRERILDECSSWLGLRTGAE